MLRVAADPGGVGPGDDELGSGDNADARHIEEFGAGRHDELFELGLVFSGFGFEEHGAAGDGSDRSNGGPVLDAVAGECAETVATVELLVGRAVPCPAAVGACSRSMP